MKPELLAPAGDLEKLKIAIVYGADAVYIGGSNFSLRARAKNFTYEQMRDGISFAHNNNAKVYVAANIFAKDKDFESLKQFFLNIQDLQADALIISDPGVFDLAKETVPNMEIHISTQANSTNSKSAMFWYNKGTKRIVTARELQLCEIKNIIDNTPQELEIESFVHGAMCISISGRCLLSSYMLNRDSNQGNCAHPCRYNYTLEEETRPGQHYPIEEDQNGTYILNSKDLCMINHIPELIAAGIASLKIEGRIKSSYYVGATVKAYREAIDDYQKDVELYNSKKQHYTDLVTMASHRHYCTGFYFGHPDAGQIYETSAYSKNYTFVGMVADYKDETATIEQRNKFCVGETLYLLSPKNKIIRLIVKRLYDSDGNPIESAPHPQQKVKIETEPAIKMNKYDMLLRS